MRTPQGLHHVEINVHDLARTKSFYSWLMAELGYKPFQEWDKGISYKNGSTYLVFTQTEAKYKEYSFHRKHTGLNHLAFWAKSRAHVDYLRVQLKENKVSFLYDTNYPFAGGDGHYALFFEDPDRIKIEIVAPR
ncbi:VOC family protein [Fictibacillus phosphorivorans]|uniref:VOC family protein n=1 Tax=Fictibacillus phosphorivorans TaxID=1221500 RepID=UPI0020401925|nr:VOC family protein [Fictibacillus phosphorivorans]MCM3719406.1 VOC family protein [Fictibacillus phosphorivorans]MCM3777116.1 VOC family protein [Fictibacillus phosphorivorans]